MTSPGRDQAQDVALMGGDGAGAVAGAGWAGAGFSFSDEREIRPEDSSPLFSTGHTSLNAKHLPTRHASKAGGYHLLDMV